MPPNRAQCDPTNVMEDENLMSATINGKTQVIQPGERLIDAINRSGVEIPQVVTTPNWDRSRHATPAWWR